MVDVGSLRGWSALEVWWTGVGRCCAFLLDNASATAFDANSAGIHAAASAESTESPVMLVSPHDGQWHVAVRFEVNGDRFEYVITEDDPDVTTALISEVPVTK